MKRIVYAVVCVLVATAVTVGPINRTPARAADVCEANVTWSFSPALSLTLNAGSANTTFNNICVSVLGSGASGLSFPAGAAAQNYLGSCLTATLTGDNNGVIIGGTVVIITAPFVQAYVLETLSPCNDAGPTPSVGVTA